MAICKTHVKDGDMQTGLSDADLDGTTYNIATF